MIRYLAPLSLVALAACSQHDGDNPAPDETGAAAPAPAAAPSAGASSAALPADGETDGRAFRYTSLDDCKVVREEHEEMPYVETLCPGPAGWALRVSDSDARQNITVVTPEGKETSLELTRIGGGGFSSVGGTAEWRGPAGAGFEPDSLIVRYRVAEAPYPEPEASNLLAVDLAPRPCVVAKVAPGPAQNSIARNRADDPGICL